MFILILVNSLCLLFLRDIYEGHLSIKDQSNFAIKLKNLDKSKKKEFFTQDHYLVQEKKFYNFKSRLFSIKNLD